MKAITIRQPHVELIMRGIKLYETRSWSTKFRGPLAIHAGVALDRDAAARFAGFVPSELPTGCIVGAVELVDCVPADTVNDQQFGDFSSGRWAWVLRNPVRWSHPIAAKGKLGFWSFDG